ncbi:hypothetical protein ABZ319_04345 [Nocardia sp. NPDC005978]|uniref:ATP-grasp domain-containing protein n=1 Tax=Nocardia sp. NPDC005978 TaxID=3156725 RepID=UPI0033AE8180
MVTLIASTRPKLVVDYLKPIDGPVQYLIPAGTESIWRSAGITAPLRTVDSWTDFNALVAAVSGIPITRILATDESTIAAAGFLRSILDVPGQKWEQALAFTDKAVMKRRLRDAGIAVARWSVVHTFAEAARAGDELTWPVVFKPRRGQSTIGTTRVESVEHLSHLIATGRFDAHTVVGDLELAQQASGVFEALTASVDGFLVEECVDVAVEYTCDIAVRSEQSVLVLTTQYLSPLLDAVGRGEVAEFITVPSDSPEAVAVQLITRRAMAALELTTGQVHCEVFRTKTGEYVLGEIGARAGGAALPALSALLFGANTIEVGFDLALGRPPAAVHEGTATPIAAVGVPMKCGRVTRVPTLAQLEALPGVIRAEIRTRIGQRSGGGLAAADAAAYLFVTAEHEPIEPVMDRARAAAAALFAFDDSEREPAMVR